MNAPVFDEIENSNNTGKIIPIYPLTFSLTQNTLRKIIENGLQKVQEQGGLPETLPDYILKEYKLENENKANYEKMDFDPKTLYIYCHGFLSPAERKFLSALVLLAAPDTAYFHWGDMDYGGIRIFLFLQKRLFPDVQPWKMDPEHYKWALERGAGIPLEAGKREKLEKLDAGMLTPLKEQILEHGQEIEQELLLL